MAKDKDNSKALAEQEEIVAAIAEDSVCVEITTAMPIGAVLVAFNQTAKMYGKAERTPQAWAEDFIADGLKAQVRTWKYTLETQNLKEHKVEMLAIKKLFTVPEKDHEKYHERLMARFEAEQNCNAKYGIQ